MSELDDCVWYCSMIVWGALDVCVVVLADVEAVLD